MCTYPYQVRPTSVGVSPRRGATKVSVKTILSNIFITSRYRGFYLNRCQSTGHLHLNRFKTYYHTYRSVNHFL